jgi:hypothetical protein
MLSSCLLRSKKEEVRRGHEECRVVVPGLRVEEKPGGRSVCAKLSIWERAVPLAA